MSEVPQEPPKPVINLKAERAKRQGGDNGGPPWKGDWQKSDNGAAVCNLYNVLVALRQAPEMRELLSYDEMARVELISRAVRQQDEDQEERPLEDTDIGYVQEWLQHQGLRRLGRDPVDQGCRMVAKEASFHPVLTYLDNLQWDGKPRLNKWLTYYLGVTFSDYSSHVGRWFIISMIARIYRPGCKVDHMLVLEGPQGLRKSTACKVLASPAWFSDSMPEVRGGDQVRLSQHLRGKWLIEIAEMASINKADAAHLKAFLTQTEEKYTPKFGRREVIEPRQCVFIGTTNKQAYLRDETGGRRFWPVLTQAIDVDALTADRDQIFAEAVAAFKAGAEWWPSKEFQDAHVTKQQEARRTVDIWEDMVSDYLGTRECCTLKELAIEALFLDSPKIGTRENNRLIGIIEAMGWSKAARGPNGERYYGSPKYVKEYPPKET